MAFKIKKSFCSRFEYSFSVVCPGLLSTSRGQWDQIGEDAKQEAVERRI